MAALPAQPYLIPSERLEKMASPKVDIFVGTPETHYSVPMDILCYYSKYFDRCFHGDSKEARERKLYLPEDHTFYFDVVLEYILTGYIHTDFKLSVVGDTDLEDCLNFMKYADLYSVSVADMGLYDDMVRILSSPDVKLKEEHIRTSFSLFPENHEMRGLIARAALNATFSDLETTYNKLEREVDGFAAEMLRQLRDFVLLDRKGTHRNWILLDG